MGTWPRANIIAHENLSGTIVQKPKKERPTLSVFNSTGPDGSAMGNGEQRQRHGGGSMDHGTDNDGNGGGISSTGSGSGKREASSFYDHVAASQSSPSVKSSSQVSNPGFVPVLNPSSRIVQMPIIHPPYLMNRHSVYGTMESSHATTDPILMPKPVHSIPGGNNNHNSAASGSGPMATQTLSRMARYNNAMDYERQQLAAMNRMSLNFTPSDQSLFFNNDQRQKSGQGGNQHQSIQPPSQQQQKQFLDMMKMSGFHPPSSSSSSSGNAAKAPATAVKPPSRDSLDVYGAGKKYHRNQNVTRYPSDSEYLGSTDVASGGNTSTLPAYMRSNHGSGGQIYGMTNRSSGPKMLPTLGSSPMQSPITTQPAACSTGMLGNAASGSISEKSAFDSYISHSSGYHHHTANSIDYQHRYQQQQPPPGREELGGSHFGAPG